jgi:hypothetical protein
MLIRKLFFNICNDFFILQRYLFPKTKTNGFLSTIFLEEKSNFIFYPLKPELFSYTIYLTLLKSGANT